jgi:hypothetical protein
MLTVYTRHTSKCPKKDNPTWRRCHCWKWITGSLPGRPGSMRVAAKTRSWEQAESLARKYEIAAVGGEEIKEARTLPTLNEAVNSYLADAQTRGLAPATIQKLEHIFKKQLLAFAEQHRVVFLRDVNVRNMTEWRSSWSDNSLARKKEFERVVGFFWFRAAARFRASSFLAEAKNSSTILPLGMSLAIFGIISGRRQQEL